MQRASKMRQRNNRNRGRETVPFSSVEEDHGQKQLEILTNIIGGVESGGQVYGQRRYEAYAGRGKLRMKKHTLG